MFVDEVAFTLHVAMTTVHRNNIQQSSNDVLPEGSADEQTENLYPSKHSGNEENNCSSPSDQINHVETGGSAHNDDINNDSTVS